MVFQLFAVFNVLSSSGWLTLLLSALFGVIFLKILFSRSKNLPPGPTGLPIVGYLPFLTKKPHLKLCDLAKSYGDVMNVDVLGMNFIHLNSAEVIREAFVTQGNEFSGRPELLPVAQQLLGNLGIIPSDGETWKIHRRFALQTLRDFGFGKNSLEERVQLISEDIVDKLKESNGSPIDLKDALATATANVICSLLFDQHFKSDSPLLQKFRDCMDKMINNVSPIQVFLNGPYMRFMPVQYFPAVNAIINANKGFEEVVTKLIKEHEETFDPTFLRDYVDVYLAEAKKNDFSAEHNTFTIDRLKAVAFDLFAAGTETTSNTLHWALRIMMFYPEIQLKVQLEIDNVIGQERLPCTKDRPDTPFTEATINEVLRFASLTPFGLLHANPEEAKFRNFVIPKRSTIVPNLWAVHHDPKYWRDPEKFDPTRFLSFDGKLEKRESFYPFSVGKRFCLGETLARTELFIFFTSILQTFTILRAEGDNDKSFKIKNSLIRSLHPYKLCARHR